MNTPRMLALVAAISGSACFMPPRAAPPCDDADVLQKVRMELWADGSKALLDRRPADDTDMSDLSVLMDEDGGLHLPTLADVRDAGPIDGLQRDQSARACTVRSTLPGETTHRIAWSAEWIGAGRMPWDRATTPLRLVVVCDAQRDATSRFCDRTFVSDATWTALWPEIPRPPVQRDRSKL